MLLYDDAKIHDVILGGFNDIYLFAINTVFASRIDPVHVVMCYIFAVGGREQSKPIFTVVAKTINPINFRKLEVLRKMNVAIPHVGHAQLCKKQHQKTYMSRQVKDRK